MQVANQVLLDRERETTGFKRRRADVLEIFRIQCVGAIDVCMRVVETAHFTHMTKNFELVRREECELARRVELRKTRVAGFHGVLLS